MNPDQDHQQLMTYLFWIEKIAQQTTAMLHPLLLALQTRHFIGRVPQPIGHFLSVSITMLQDEAVVMPYCDNALD